MPATPSITSATRSTRPPAALALAAGRDLASRQGPRPRGFSLVFLNSSGRLRPAPSAAVAAPTPRPRHLAPLADTPPGSPRPGRAAPRAEGWRHGHAVARDRR